MEQYCTSLLFNCTTHAHLNRDFECKIDILFDVIMILTIQSGHKLAYITTAHLPSHVHFELIG